jgi:hypothetical protein
VAKTFCACNVGILDIFSKITSRAGWQCFSSSVSNRISAPFPKLPHNSGVNKIRSWIFARTNRVLDRARHLYQEEGYLIKQEAQQSFGKSLVGETWELAL